MKTAKMEVVFIDSMGSDLTVVNSARVSFNKESVPLFVNDDGVIIVDQGDERLINYLAKHNHWTPFGHCTAQFRVKAPIFVARQLVKHQVGLVWNEVSRRYVDDEPEFWFPNVWRGRPEGSMKQGSSDVYMNDVNVAREGIKLTVEDVATAVASTAAYHYMQLVEAGVAPEQARMILPLNMMTEWYWTGSLAAWARVCKLRLDPHAQKETSEIAGAIDEHMAALFPASWKALIGDPV